MKRRDAIFDRLALKEKLFINQQMRNLGALNSELQKLEDMRQKLSEMAAIRYQKPRTNSLYTAIICRTELSNSRPVRNRQS